MGGGYWNPLITLDCSQLSMCQSWENHISQHLLKSKANVPLSTYKMKITDVLSIPSFLLNITTGSIKPILTVLHNIPNGLKNTISMDVLLQWNLIKLQSSRRTMAYQ